jgi:hypothetical protein
MIQVDDDGYMKVAMGGDVIRRRAIVSVIGHCFGGPDIEHARPQLHEGEILCERIGMIPLIRQDRKPGI